MARDYDEPAAPRAGAEDDNIFADGPRGTPAASPAAPPAAPPAAQAPRRPATEARPAAPASAPAATPPETPKPPAKKRKGSLVPKILGLAILGAAGWFGWQYWTVGRFMISTDDAYVAADYATLAPKVSGYVARIEAQENTPVTAGQPIIRLEDGDYRVALRSAEAGIEAQKAAAVRAARQVEAAQAAVTQARAQVAAAQASVDQAKADFDRYSRLAQEKIASTQTLDNAMAAEKTATANLKAAEAGVESARAAVTVAEASQGEIAAALKSAEAARDQAARNLEATVIRAPFDGVVGNLAVAAGDFVGAGKRLMAVIPLGAVHIDANFKETQLADLTPGAPVTLEFDAWPDRHVTGRVETVAPATGSVFSLLPPENATGNFTKVVQRVPVRISIPEAVRAQGWIRPGMSVVATVDAREVSQMRVDQGGNGDARPPMTEMPAPRAGGASPYVAAGAAGPAPAAAPAAPTAPAADAPLAAR